MAHKKGVEKEMDIGWNYGKMVDNNHRQTQCNFCKKKMYGGVTRLKEHIAGIGSDVASCKEAPKEVKENMKAHMLAKKKEKQAAKLEKQRVQEELMRKPQGLESDEDDEEDEDQAELRRAMKASRESIRENEMYRSNRGLGEGSRLSSRSKSVHIQGEVDFGTRNIPKIDSFMQKKEGKSQSSIRTAMKGIKDAKKHIGRAISKFFFYNHIPHNVANSPYYETMVDAIADAGRGVKPPTAWEISNTYLDTENEEIGEYMKQHEKYWDEYGCTLMCDGWSTQNRREIINFLVYSTYGTVFIDSIDATDEFQSAEYICSLMDSMVERIGEERVVQVVTDNGANYKAAGHLLMEKRKHLYWTPCAAHCIDLILEDMAKEEEVKNIIEQCQKITGYIYNHGWLLSMMRKETGQKELIRPAVTRFATHFIALNSIYVHRDDLKRMVLSRGWMDKIPRLTAKDRTVAFRVQAKIQNETFWNDIACVIIVFEPLVKVLRMVDSDDMAEMGYLYEAMDRAKESIRHNIGRGYKKWWNIIDRRWDKQLHRDIHAAGSANTTSNQVDLFGESLVGDLMDAPTSVPTESVTFNNPMMPEVDLFADASFVSASPHTEATTGSHDQGNINLFASQPVFPAPVSASVDSFGASDSILLPEMKYSTSELKNSATFDPFALSDSGICSDTKSSVLESTNTFDPFAAIPLNNFEKSDAFGAFTSHAQQNVINNVQSSMDQPSLISPKPAPKKDAFHVKSGIWADSLSRGLIDLNITAPKTTNLADVGIVGGLGDDLDGKEKGPTTAWYMGKAMGAGSGTGWSGFSSSTGSQHQRQFGNFK